MGKLIKYFALVIVALPLFLSCGGKADDEPTIDPNSTTNSTGYRCVLEVWTNMPAKDLHFWSCTWRGDLAQDGKLIETGQRINISKDLGVRHSLETKYYKTEFINSRAELLVLNFWVFPKSGYVPYQSGELQVTYKAKFYIGNKLIKTEEEQDHFVGIAGQSFQVSIASDEFGG